MRVFFYSFNYVDFVYDCNSQTIIVKTRYSVIVDKAKRKARH
nr:MAG TPA: hypothetical protein [Caudoviricetes sp.]